MNTGRFVHTYTLCGCVCVYEALSLCSPPRSLGFSCAFSLSTFHMQMNVYVRHTHAEARTQKVGHASSEAHSGSRTQRNSRPGVKREFSTTDSSRLQSSCKPLLSQSVCLCALTAQRERACHLMVRTCSRDTAGRCADGGREREDRRDCCLWVTVNASSNV